MTENVNTEDKCGFLVSSLIVSLFYPLVSLRVYDSSGSGPEGIGPMFLSAFIAFIAPFIVGILVWVGLARGERPKSIGIASLAIVATSIWLMSK